MRKLMVGFLIAVMLVLVSATSAQAGASGPLFRNCGPGKAVVVHWHNYKYGYVDIYWTLNKSNFAGSQPKVYGNFGKGNHSRSTGKSAVYHGYGQRASQNLDTYWTSCTSAL